jgi:chitodextrinase
MIRSATPMPGTPIIDLAQPANNPANVVRVMRIFPESKWNEIFPVRKSIYTYTEFLKSVAKFPAFCNEIATDSGLDIDIVCKTELATVFAHMVQET